MSKSLKLNLKSILGKMIEEKWSGQMKEGEEREEEGREGQRKRRN